jgi:hypothetical protein
MAEALHQLDTAHAKHAHPRVADVMPNYGGSRAVIGDPEPIGIGRATSLHLRRLVEPVMSHTVNR